MISRAKVLIVDDDPIARETTSALLHRDPYHLVFADDGTQAIETLDRDPFDLVLCDVLMPGTDGLELCRRIKAHPAWRFTPVILLTALDGQDDMVRGIEAGADDFLTKPIDRVVLRARARAMLRVRERFHELRAAAPDLESLLRERRERIVGAANLTQREVEVLDLLLLGRSHEEIAAVLGLSPRTIKHHQAHVLEKLGADSRVDLARIFL